MAAIALLIIVMPALRGACETFALDRVCDEVVAVSQSVPR
jgi:hypothetical protein